MKKKVWLSLFIIVSFVIYALAQSLTRLGVRLGRDDEERGSGRNEDKAESGRVAVKQPVASAQSNQSTTVPSSQTAPPSQPTVPAKTKSNGYQDGQYIGQAVDVYYGNVQVKAVIQSGKIVDVQFLDYPQDRSTSREIAAMSMPILRSEAISAQNFNVDGVSGATETSRGFVLSLQSALAKAK